MSRGYTSGEVVLIDNPHLTHDSPHNPFMIGGWFFSMH